MRIVVVKLALESDLKARIERLIEQLRSSPDTNIEMRSSLVVGPDANAYLLCGSAVEHVTEELERTAGQIAARLPRTILIGLPIRMPFAAPLPRAKAIVPGSAASFLERFRLGGSIEPASLSRPDGEHHFGGPKALMRDMRTNELKGLETDNYAMWGAVHSPSAAAFLIAYAQVLDAAIAAGRFPEA